MRMIERPTRWMVVLLFVVGCPDPPAPSFPDIIPSPPDIPTVSDPGCMSCHKGIEDAHPKLPLSCTDCHGGDGEATTKEEGHVALSSSSFKIRKMATDQLDTLSEEEMLFINPGDLRVAHRGCGGSSPANGGSGCHQSTVETARRSVMQTFTGHYNHPRFLAGMQGREAVYGVTDVFDPGYDETIQGCVEELTPLRTPVDVEDRTSTASIMDHYLPQHCPSCHTASFGKNDSPGNYRSSGCSACHMVYANNGASLSNDSMIAKGLPSHPIKHELTTAIPTQQCEHCHYQGARIGLSFQGIREGGFNKEGMTPPNGVSIGETLHGHGPGFYFTDEDDTNDYDETPPDIHFERGMHCADCHTPREVHGDGHLYSTAKGQLDVHCVDCHGTVRETIQEMTKNADGVFRTAKGTPLDQLRIDNGNVILTGRVDGKDHFVTQIKDRLQNYGPNSNMHQAMGVDPVTDFSHTDSMECWTCHTSWRLSCFGCHVQQHDQSKGTDLQTGQKVEGLVFGKRDWFAIDLFVLGTNGRGMIDSMCPSMQIFMDYTNADGEKLVENRVRRTASGKVGFGWMPTNPHTIRPRLAPSENASPGVAPCARCHVKEDSSNLDQVRAVYGFGAPWYGFKLTDDEGIEHDLTQMLNEDATPISEYPHEGSGPVPAGTIERMLKPGSHLLLSQ